MSQNKGWFSHKAIGYGSGLPTAWQGWAVMLAYIAIAIVAGLVWESGDEVYSVVAAVVFVLATLAFVLIARAKTPGGWRWRGPGSKD